jgi:hypothetical protein
MSNGGQAPAIGAGGLEAGGFSSEAGSLPSVLSGNHQAPAAAAGASVSVDQPVFAFGTVYNGNDVKHVFRLKSVGTVPLVIGGVETSCGCTAAEPSKRNVPPGAESDIAVTFDTHADKGPATRIVTVFTNDPKHEQLQLTLKGDVKPQVDVTPTPVTFDKVKHGTQISREVTVTDTRNDRSFKVGPISNSNRDIQVSQRPLPDGKPGAVLQITLLKTMQAGPFNDMVKIATSRTTVDLPVYGTVLGNINVAPPQISFGIVPHNESALRIVRLTNSGDRLVKVIGISSTNPSVTAASEPVKEGKEYKITVQLRPDTPDGTLRGTLAIKTDDPGQQTLQVPFYGIVGTFRG